MPPHPISWGHSHFQRPSPGDPSSPWTEGPNPALDAPTPTTGAEQTEKADAPREPVELKPDPTSGMAAAEAEAALSESSEQGTFHRLGRPSLRSASPTLPATADLTLSHSLTSAFGPTSSFLIPEL